MHRTTATSSSRHTWARKVVGAALVIASAVTATTLTAPPASAAPVEPTVIDTVPGQSEFGFVGTTSSGDLIYLSSNDEFVRFNTDDKTKTTLASNVVIPDGSALPRSLFVEAAEFRRLLLFRNASDELQLLDRESGALTTLGSIGADARVERVVTGNDNALALVVDESPDPDNDIKSLYVTTTLAAVLPNPVDVYEFDGFTSPQVIGASGNVAYLKGLSGARVLTLVVDGDVSPVVENPRRWGAAFSSDTLWYALENGDDFDYFVRQPSTAAAAPLATLPELGFVSFFGSSPVARIRDTFVSTTGDFSPWTPDVPDTPEGLTGATFSARAEPDFPGTLLISWAFSGFVDNAFVRENGPVRRYPLAGGTPTELPIPPDVEPSDALFTTFYGGEGFLIEDESTMTAEITYKAPNKPLVTIDSGANYSNFSVVDGAGRLQYTRDDGTVNLYTLETGDVQTVTVTNDRVDLIRLGRDSGVVVVEDTCSADCVAGARLSYFDSPSAAVPRAFQALNPSRLLDTRANGETVDDIGEKGGRVTPGSTTEVEVLGRAGVPFTGGTAYLNVTAVQPSEEGFLTVAPCGADIPVSSNVNYVAGQTVPNAVAVKIGAGGKICVFSSAATNLIVDLTGYNAINGDARTLTPARLLDTRPNGETVDGIGEKTGRSAALSVTEVDVAGRAGVPENARTVFLNVTALRPSAEGFLTVLPCGIDVPVSSNVNYLPGQIVPNAALARIGEGGKVCIYSSAETHLLVDVSGYLSSGSTASISPARYLDTRGNGATFDGVEQRGGASTAGGITEVTIVGRRVSSSTAAVFLNVTSVRANEDGFLSVFPCGEEVPNSSNLNYKAGQVIANSVLAKIGAGGKVCIFSATSTNLLVDVNGLAFKNSTLFF